MGRFRCNVAGVWLSAMGDALKYRGSAGEITSSQEDSTPHPCTSFNCFSQQVWVRTGKIAGLSNLPDSKSRLSCGLLAVATLAWSILRPGTHAVPISQLAWDSPPLKGRVAFSIIILSLPSRYTHKK